jgi:hypothetical protein
MVRGCQWQWRTRFTRFLAFVVPGSLSVGPAWGSDLIGPDITTHCHPLPPTTTHPRITTHYHALPRTTTHCNYHALRTTTTTHYHLPPVLPFAFYPPITSAPRRPLHLGPRYSVLPVTRASHTPAARRRRRRRRRRGGAFFFGAAAGGAMGGHMNANGLLWHGGMGGDPQGAWLHCVVCRKSKKEEAERSFCFCFC